MLSVVTSLLAGAWLERIAPQLGAPRPEHEPRAGELPGELGAT
jgi:hypothetical protein